MKEEITTEQALKNVLEVRQNTITFVYSLIKKEEEVKAKLQENLDLYKSLNLMNDFDKTFSQWNNCIIVLFNLKDILCRLGEDVD